MSTLEEFESAPVGATATGTDGRTAVKTPHKEWPWSLFDQGGERIAHGNNHHMATQGYTLNPAPPSTAREALDLAWDLAHPVREGQVIPAYERTIGMYEDGDFYLERRSKDRPASVSEETFLRTLDPLQDPLPDWLDAPAVLATHESSRDLAPNVWLPAPFDHDRWICGTNGVLTTHWSELRDVTPLYPKGQDE